MQLTCTLGQTGLLENTGKWQDVTTETQPPEANSKSVRLIKTSKFSFERERKRVMQCG